MNNILRGMRRHAMPAMLTMLVLLFVVIGCKKDPQITEDGAVVTENIVFAIPQNWPTPNYLFQNNTLTPEGFALGRKLFFDARLSKDNTISCGSCHQPFASFANLDHEVSHGINNLLGVRNAPALINLNWQTSFQWDGGANHIEVQPLVPIQNALEMGETLANVIDKLNADADYKSRFKKVFGDATINSQRIFKALAQFEGMLVSANAKFDQYRRGEAGVTLTASEQRGLALYQEQCSSCHKEPLFSDYSFRNNGLKPSVLNDSGRATVTRLAVDMYRFKVPTLRNLKYTAPYMHDGRLTTLDDVLDHYATGIDTTMATLDPQLKGRIPLNTQQRTDLLSFLGTLNDETFVKDARFQQQ